ncbi:MAG: CPBP family intramembrane metalloprotease [Deltaproteobacteria bacterium]|nr:CPBP family intramembrane metalloprotease [Candidatus Zymogenaceae bacterium]
MPAPKQKATFFLLITFGVSWLIALVYYLADGRWNTPLSVVVGAVFMLVPMLSALFVQKVLYRQAVVEPLGISFRINVWFLTAWLLPALLVFCAIPVAMLLPGVSFSPEHEGLFRRMAATLSPQQIEAMRESYANMRINPALMSLVQGLIAGATINALLAFGEELGWRGLLQREWEHLGVFTGSALIGLVWGVWHAPLIVMGHNFPDHPAAGIFQMIAATMLLGILISYIRLRAKSVIPAALMHGSTNGLYGVSLMYLDWDNDLSIGLFGTGGCLVMGGCVILLFFYDRFLSKQPLFEK